jgi:large subunit ribosomal protein L20
MVRVKRGNVARKRRKKILSLASGYRGAHSVLFQSSKSTSNESITLFICW